MIEIGQVKLVQIQIKPLKVGEKADRYYDPAGIRQVDHLRLTTDGVIGITPDGTEIVDIHNATHPQTRNNGTNGISIGFTSHYHAMRTRFGDHLKEGIAGENILIQADQPFRLEDLGERIAFQSAVSGELIVCHVTHILAPCREFSGFCAGRGIPEATLKAALQFLGEGQRGFKIKLAESRQQPLLRIGDRVFLMD